MTCIKFKKNLNSETYLARRLSDDKGTQPPIAVLSLRKGQKDISTSQKGKGSRRKEGWIFLLNRVSSPGEKHH